jgi:hypothetical protein
VNLSLRNIVSAALLGLALAAGTAQASNAVLTRDGTLYEVYRTSFAELDPDAAGKPEGRYPVLALRTTRSGSAPAVDMVLGTWDPNPEDSAAVEYDETTKTIFVVYTQYTGLMSDVHFAIRRGNRWLEKNIDPNIGLYLSLNPRLLVTRQQYLTKGDDGKAVSRWRSILSLVWWEESRLSQARYAAAFVEDGTLDLDTFTVVDLNELAGVTGPTPIQNLPFSAYEFPALQRDPTTNGGVLVSFVNLAAAKSTTLRITFNDDETKPGTETTASGPSRRHTPIGGRMREGSIPRQLDTNSPVGTFISPLGVPVFYWEEANALRFLRGDAPDQAEPLAVPLRKDFPMERAVGVLRDMVEKD